MVLISPSEKFQHEHNPLFVAWLRTLARISEYSIVKLMCKHALPNTGISDTARFVEDSPSGKDYLADVCREWEAAARAVKGPRLVLLRTGIVLDKDGGALGRACFLMHILMTRNLLT